MVGDAANHGLDSDVMFVGLVVGDKADMAGEDGDADGLAEIAEGERAGLADFAGSGGDEADGALDGGDIGIVFAVIGGNDCEEGKVFAFAGGFPFGGFAFELKIPGTAELGTAETEGFDRLNLLEGRFVVLSPEDDSELEWF
jgi:hypothetical protein